MKNNVAEIRKKQGYTQEQLAEALGTNKAMVSHLETGKRKLTQEWLEEIAKALNCTPNDLLGQSTHKNPIDHLNSLANSFKDDDLIKMNIEILRKLIVEKEK